MKKRQCLWGKRWGRASPVCVIHIINIIYKIPQHKTAKVLDMSSVHKTKRFRESGEICSQENAENQYWSPVIFIKQRPGSMMEINARAQEQFWKSLSNKGFSCQLKMEALSHAKTKLYVIHDPYMNMTTVFFKWTEAKWKKNGKIWEYFWEPWTPSLPGKIRIILFFFF